MAQRWRWMVHIPFRSLRFPYLEWNICLTNLPSSALCALGHGLVKPHILVDASGVLHSRFGV